MSAVADTPRFRTAGDPDVPALVDLVNSAYRGERSRRGWTTEADLLGGQRADTGMVAELLAKPDTTVLLAETDGQPVGCCELRRASDGEAYVGMLAVSPTMQGSGLGGRVLERAEGFVAARWGARRIRMLVLRQRRDLIAWYERRGYRRTGATSPFPYGDARFGVPRRPDLEFEELERDLPVQSPHA